MAGRGRRRKPPRQAAQEQPEELRRDLDFHYHRRDRLSLPTAPKFPEQESFFRRYRGVLIILVDIAILVVLGFVFLRFFGPPDSSDSIGPYRATLRALEYGETLLVTVTVQRAGGGVSEESGGRVFVRWSAARRPQDSEAFFDSAVLPQAPEGKVVLRAVLPIEGFSDRIYAEVEIDSRSVVLSLPLES
jgi:hypothetical protein